MTEEDDEIDEHEPDAAWMEGSRSTSSVCGAQLTLRDWPCERILSARITVLGVRALTRLLRRRAGRFLYKAPLGTPPSVTIGPVAPQLSSRRPRDVACSKCHQRRLPRPRSLRRLRSTRRRRRRQRSRPAPSGRRSPKTLRSAATSRCVAAQLPAKAPEASAVFSTRLASLALAPSSALSSCSWPRRHRPLNPILSLTLVPPPFYFYSLAADC